MPRAPLRRRQLNRDGPAPSNPRFKKPPSSSPAKAELARRLANKPVGSRPTDSDDSDRLVVKANVRRGRYAPKQEIYASGAVGAGDKPGSYPTRAQRRKSLTDATTEILANGQKDTRKEKGTGATKAKKAQQQSEEEPQDKSRHVNGGINKPPTAKKNTGAPSPLASSAVKPARSILEPVQLTPTRENSILGTLKPRRRQPSILQNLDQDSSSFNIGDEEEFLPHDESTPFKDSNPHQPVSASASLLSSASRKRKFGVSVPLDPAEPQSLHKPTSSPLSALGNTPEPSLPTSNVSALRESGRKHRESTRNEDDIMALPASSSSAPSSPIVPKPAAPTAKVKKQSTKSAPTMTTKDLLEGAMPSKRQRNVRERTRNRDFDIPADPDSDAPVEEDESVFLPAKKGRKTKRKEPLSKSSTARTKANAKPLPGKATKSSQASAKAAGKAKSSTNHISSATAPVLTPSTSTSNRETKSPSQQHSTTYTSPTSNLETAEAEKSKPYGGSRLSRRISDKENQAAGDSSEIEDSHERAQDVGKTAPPTKGKWADIDSWDMDFEEVEVFSSSSPTRR